MSTEKNRRLECNRPSLKKRIREDQRSVMPCKAEEGRNEKVANVKVTGRGLRPLKMVKSVDGKSAVAWFVKANAKYKTKVENTIKNGI